MRLAAVLMFVILAAAATQATAQSTSIIPGRGIGPIEIGTEIGEARRLLEQFGRVQEANNPGLGAIVCNLPASGFCVTDYLLRFDRGRSPDAVIKTPNRVAQIVTFDRRFIAEDGLRVGVNFLFVIKLLGLPDAGRWSQYQWTARGLGITLTGGSDGLVVREVFVMAPFPP